MALDELMPRTKRREIREIPIAPILDMLVAVIFFLLLATSFDEYARQTLPPVSSAPSEAQANVPPPLSPKLFVRDAGGARALVLSWEGARPGSLQAIADERTENPGALARQVASLVDRFAQTYPSEGTLRIGFSPSVAYQDVIAVMDGARGHIKDVVFISYVALADGTK